MKRFALCAALIASCSISAFAWESDDYGFLIEDNYSQANAAQPRTPGLFDRLRRRRAPNVRYVQVAPVSAEQGAASVLETAPEATSTENK